MLRITNKKIVSGFTLLEMIIVLIIIAIIYSFAAPNLSRYNQTKILVNEAEKLAGVITTAKSYSLAQHETYKVAIDATMKIYYYLLATETGERYHRDSLYRCDKSISVVTAPAEIVFATDGSITAPTGDETQPVVITLSGAYHKRIDIAINRRTGRVTVSALY